MENATIKILTDQYKRSTNVIANQLTEYVKRSEKCPCSCHVSSKDEEERIQKIEQRMKESENLIQQFMDKEKENKLKMASLLTNNEILKSSLNAITHQLTEHLDELSNVTDEREGMASVESKEQGIQNAESNSRSLVIRNPNIPILNRKPELEAGASSTFLHPNEAFHRERVKLMDRRPHVQLALNWHMEMEQEKAKGRANELKDGGGIQTVICLDTSSSMLENNAWRQACMFLNDYINGLDRESSIRDKHPENVALVTFGNRTTVLQHLTNDFDTIRKTLNSVVIGGPSPLYKGLNMTAAAWYSRDERSSICHNVDGIGVFRKIILITDGQPTDTHVSTGPDSIYLESEAMIKSKILEIAEGISSYSIDLFIVQVGEENTEFMDFLVEMSDGVKLSYKDGHKMAKRTTLTIQAAREQKEEQENPYLELTRMYELPRVSEEENIAKKQNVERSNKKVNDQRKQINKIMFYERGDSSLPAVGTRVKRGPAWSNDLGLDDAYGPGTIIGHDIDELKVWVTWDITGRNGIYRHGASGYFELRIVHEYKKLPLGCLISVGCKVHPGRHWQPGRAEEFLTGVAIQCSREDNIDQTRVKWTNGRSGWYSVRDHQEQVVVCDRLGRCFICDEQGTDAQRAIGFRSTPNKKNKNM